MKLCLSLPAAVLLGVCSAFAQDPKPTADILTGDAKGSAAEASKYVGKTVGAGENAAGGSACQWADKDDEGDMMAQIVAARTPSSSEGRHPLAST